MKPILVLPVSQLPNIRNIVFHSSKRRRPIPTRAPSAPILVPVSFPPMLVLLLNERHGETRRGTLLVPISTTHPIGDIAQDILLVDQALLDFEFLLVDCLLHVEYLAAGLVHVRGAQLRDQALG